MKSILIFVAAVAIAILCGLIAGAVGLPGWLGGLIALAVVANLAFFNKSK